MVGNKESEYFNRDFLNGLTDGVIYINDKQIVEFINHSGLQLLGLQQDQALGKDIADVLILQTNDGQTIGKDELPFRQNMQKDNSAIILDASSTNPYVLVRADRSIFPASMSITADLPSVQTGSTGGKTILFHDLSAAQKIDEAKSEFVALISHQLRTPLNVVAWYVEKLLAQKHGSLTTKQRKYLQEIYTSNQRIIDHVRAIVNVSRTDLRRLKHKHEKVNIERIFEEIEREFKPIFAGKQISFTLKNTLENPIMHDSDKEAVSIILKNLVSNSSKYTANGGWVQLNARNVSVGELLSKYKPIPAPSDGIVLSITDNGIGIPDKEKSQIFTKLFRGSNVKSLDVTGIGLGLYIVASFLEELGGAVWFSSEVHRGTSFAVFLPS